MRALEVRIAPVNEGKGRTFRSAVLGMAQARDLWEGGEADGLIRPAFVVFAGSDQELRPFVANALAGRRVLFTSEFYRRREERLELLKSARYEVAWQRGEAGSTATVFLSDIFRVDPGMVDPAGVSFVMLPRAAWLAEQVIPDADLHARHARSFLGGERVTLPSDEELREMVPLAHLFATYLDRRTRCPIVSDGRFYLQLMLACLREGLACFPRPTSGYCDLSRIGYRSSFRFTDTNLSAIGIARGIAFSAPHSEVERVLAEQTTLYFQKVS